MSTKSTWETIEQYPSSVVNRQYKNTHEQARKGKTRNEQLLPNGNPRWIRCYDNGGETIDRFTVVFTGKRGGYYVGMSYNPNSPQGYYQHGGKAWYETQNIDKPSYGHLGRKVHFSNLPKNCKNAIRNEYCEIWEIELTHKEKTTIQVEEWLEENQPEMYFDYRDKLSDDNLIKIIEGGIEEYYEVQDELWEDKIDYIWQLESETKKECAKEFFGELLEMYKDEICQDCLKDELESWYEDNCIEKPLLNRITELLQEDFLDYGCAKFDGIDKLIENSEININVTLDYETFEIYNWIEDISYDELAPLLTLLKINPRELCQYLDLPLSEYPNYKHRDNPLINPKAFCQELLERTTSYCVPCFTIDLNILDFIKNRDKYKKITLHAGTPLYLWDNINGSCSLGEAELLNDLTLNSKQFHFSIDSGNSYGLQSICGMSSQPWSVGVTPAR